MRWGWLIAAAIFGSLWAGSHLLYLDEEIWFRRRLTTYWVLVTDKGEKVTSRVARITSIIANDVGHRLIRQFGAEFSDIKFQKAAFLIAFTGFELWYALLTATFSFLLAHDVYEFKVGSFTVFDLHELAELHPLVMALFAGGNLFWFSRHAWFLAAGNLDDEHYEQTVFVQQIGSVFLGIGICARIFGHNDAGINEYAWIVTAALVPWSVLCTAIHIKLFEYLLARAARGTARSPLYLIGAVAAPLLVLFVIAAVASISETDESHLPISFWSTLLLAMPLNALALIASILALICGLVAGFNALAWSLTSRIINRICDALPMRGLLLTLTLFCLGAYSTSFGSQVQRLLGIR